MSDSPTDDEGLGTSGESLETQTAGTSIGDQVSGVNTPASPSGDSIKDDNKPKDIADAVRAALNPKEEHSSGSGDDRGTTGEPANPDARAEGEGEELGEPTAEELASYKPKTKRRIEQFKSQITKLSTDITSLTTERDSLRPRADRFDTVQKFVKEANLSTDDVNTGFTIMKLLRNDPQKAMTALTPIYEQLRILVGDILPQDLSMQVKEGKITEAVAKELSRLRSAQGLTVAQTRELEDRNRNSQQAELAQQIEVLKVDVGKAVTEWETRWKVNDPDYSLKHGHVMDALDLEVRKRKDAGTLPNDVRSAVDMAEQVKKDVEKKLLRLLPKRNPTVTHNGPGVNNGTKPVPKTLHEAVAQAVGFN